MKKLPYQITIFFVVLSLLIGPVAPAFAQEGTPEAPAMAITETETPTETPVVETATPLPTETSTPEPIAETSTITPMLPVMVNELFWSLGVTTYYVIYGRLGTDSVAAMNIVASIEQVAFTVFIGLANATSVNVGNRIGAGQEDEAFLYAGRSLGIALVGGLVTGLILQILKVPILGLFKVSPEVLVNAGYVINVVCLFLWVRVNNMIIVVGILRAGGDTKFSMFLDGFIIWIVGVPLAALGAYYFHFPVYFVYLLAMSEELTKWILGIHRYRSRKWINNLALHV